MKVIGFNFFKISAERTSEIKDSLTINSQINITDISSLKNDVLKTKEDLLGVKFNLAINYDPNFAKLIFTGSVLLTIDQKESKEILQKWKDKTLSEEFNLAISNIIIRKATVKALELEEDLNLPTHITLPILKREEKH